MNEPDAAYAWISSTLTGDATLRALPLTAPIARKWFRHIAPTIDPATKATLKHPFGVYSQAAARDSRGIGVRVLSVLDVDVRIVSVAGTDASAAVARMDELLDAQQTGAPRGSVVVDGVTYYILGCARRATLSFASEEAGVVYESAGGTYRLTISR
jgi:hypothetical protein